jgi:hypothetical protein
MTGASSGGHNSVAPLATLHQAGGQPGHLDDDAGSSSCCSSRGSPMLQGVRRQGGGTTNPLLSSSSAPPGAVAAYLMAQEGGLPSCLLQGSANNLASHLPGNTAGGPLGGMSGQALLSSQYQQQLSAAAIGAGAGVGLMHGMPLFRSSGGSSMGAYAAARAAAVSATTAGRPQAVTRTWHAMLPSDAAAVAGMQAGAAGAGSFDSCGDIWGGGQDAAALDIMLQKVSRSRMEQTPGSSARQAAAAAAASYQALHAQHQQHQQQQLQEMEQLQHWQRLQAHHQAAAESGNMFAPFTGMHLPHHAAEAMFHSYSTSAVAAMAASGSAAAAAGSGAGQCANGGPGGNEAAGGGHFLGAHGHSSSMPLLSGYFSAPPAYGAAAAGSSKASLDAVAATAAELVAMVNPAELLGEDLCWQGAGGAPPGPSGQGPNMPAGRGPLTPTTNKQAPGPVGGLDAADIADLWNVLGDCDGADKEGCGGLFEPLGDLF